MFDQICGYCGLTKLRQKMNQHTPISDGSSCLEDHIAKDSEATSDSIGKNAHMNE